jgi:hypothetical protein
VNSRQIVLYIERTVAYAERLNKKSSDLNDPRVRNQMMSDCVELHEITNRLYALLYRFGRELPDSIDPDTLRYRAYNDQKEEGKGTT